MRAALSTLLAERPVLLADGATGTNYFALGLTAGDAPELWTFEHPDRVAQLHRAFVAAGADIILTNTFGANRSRLALHGGHDRTQAYNIEAARIARSVADAEARPVVVAGSVGPTGELLAPLGALGEGDAEAIFREQIEGLVEGGVDVAWIETMSAPEEVRAAARAAIAVGIPYVATCSFDTAGCTMMGLAPRDLAGVFDGLAVAPLATGANCGVGAPDILAALIDMAAFAGRLPVVSKGNCGIPRFVGTDIEYSGTPELMAEYVRLAIDGGARIVGGCCGTSPDHLAAMRHAIDAHVRADAPSIATIIERVGPLVAPPAGSVAERPRTRRRTRTP